MDVQPFSVQVKYNKWDGFRPIDVNTLRTARRFCEYCIVSWATPLSMIRVVLDGHHDHDVSAGLIFSNDSLTIYCV